MDDIDIAQANDEFFRQKALNEHFRKRKDQPPPHGDRIKSVPTQSIADGAGGDSGICIDCGDDIEAARLEAVPDALRCITCQEKLERRRR